MWKNILFGVFLLYSGVIFSQEHRHLLQEKEVQLKDLLTSLRSTTDNAQLFEINDHFKEEFLNTLEIEGAFDYPFNSLTSVGKIYSQDKLVRVITWNIQLEDFSHEYYSFILKKNERTNRVSITELTREKQNLYHIQYETVGSDNWYGALYYDIIDVKRRNRTYYTLLGYDANTMRSDIKIIDVLYFTGKDPQFGLPIFASEQGKVNRLLFEYSAKATMSLKFDNSRNKIILDHLTPEVSSMKDFREFYIPDLSYDAYTWNGNQWELSQDVIAVNKATPEKIELRRYDSKTDSTVSISIKTKWINPQNANSPVYGGTHRAVTPEDIEQIENSKKVNSRKNNRKTKKPKIKDKGLIYSNINGKKVKAK